MRFATALLFACGVAVVSAQEAPKLTQAEQEAFLKTAKVKSTRGAKNGVTGTLRATLSDGTITHEAQIQSIDESKTKFETAKGIEMNFRDSYKYNIAAYRLGKMLGITNIPPSVGRSFSGKASAFTWWIDDVMMEEGQRQKKKLAAPDLQRWNDQVQYYRVFDQLIYNTDRNLGNMVITKDWTIWMIDHTRAFRLSHDLRNPAFLVKCDRGLLAGMKKLTEAGLRETMNGVLTNPEINGLLKRRDKIVTFFENAGEASLYTLTPQP